MSSLRAQWRALSVHDRYAVAMFTVLFILPGVTLLGAGLVLLWTVVT